LARQTYSTILIEEAVMKANIFVAALLLLIVGCTLQQSDQLTQQQKEQIKSEVKVVMDSIIGKWQRLDVEGAVQYYSPEMVAVGDSSIIDYQAYKKLWLDMPKYIGTAKWTTTQWEFMVLSKDLVVSAAVGKLELFMKSGDKVTANPKIYTDIWKKVGDQWKVIYEHGSGTPVMQKAGKK
jgi:hypothetical protein